MPPMQQKPSLSRSEPTWNGSAPVAGQQQAVQVPVPAEQPPAARPTAAQPIAARPIAARPIALEQRPEPRSEQAPVPHRRTGWVVGLVIVVGLCVVALLLALMIQVASDQVQRNQQQPTTRLIGR